MNNNNWGGEGRKKKFKRDTPCSLTLINVGRFESAPRYNEPLNLFVFGPGKT